MRTHCRNGHEMTGKNITWTKGPKGLMWRKCRRCQSLRERTRYRTDEEHRTKQRAAALARYHRRKNGLEHQEALP